VSTKHDSLRRWQGEKYKSNIGEILVDEVRKTYPEAFAPGPALDMLIELFDKEYKALAGGLLVPVSPMPLIRSEDVKP
jgi:hypothetical protein